MIPRRGFYKPRRQASQPVIEPEKLDPREQAIRDAERVIFAAKRALKIQKARQAGPEALQAFIELMMPDPEAPDDCERSLFQCRPHHKILIEMWADIEAKRTMRSGISCPPQHGKSLATKFGMAWTLGRSPHLRVLFATYSDGLATTRGDELREVLQSRIFKEIFPAAGLRTGSQAKDEMVFLMGGSVNFVGRGTATTGRPADLFVIDDPYKDEEEGSSELIRTKVKEWYSAVVFSRCHVLAPIFIVHCMTGDTPVLRPDGGETPLRDIRPGDEVATYRDGVLSVSQVRNWINHGPDQVFAIRTASGAVVKANARHPFLVSTDGGPRWVKTRDLSLGLEIVRVSGGSGKDRHVAPMAATSLSSAEATASLTTTRSDGPTGSALRPQTTLRVDAPTISALATVSHQTSISACSTRKEGAAPSAASLPPSEIPEAGSVTACSSTTATTPEKSARFCATLATLRRDTSRTPLPPNAWPPSSDFMLDQIVEICPAGTEDVFDIEVAETENFIAGGLVSHNTRWNEDDLLGWLTDPEHPENRADPSRLLNAEGKQRWRYVNLPTPVEDAKLAKALGIPPGSPLWPERFPLHHLAEAEKNNPRIYAALYRGQPSPADGDFFRAEHIQVYRPDELPKELRLYAASDHAVSTKQTADNSCLIPVGVCRNDIIWVLPDVWWDRKPTDVVVEAMIGMMERHDFLWWRAASDHISKSVGPFLRRRMLERRVFCNIVEGPEAGDKMKKAQAIQARMAMGKVRFPAWAPWLMRARAELLKFPHAKHDDFVDALSHIGRGLRVMPSAAAATAAANDDGVPKPGTLGWIKWASEREKRATRRANRLRAM